MTLGLMQPCLLPYLSYFRLMKAVDVFIIADDYQFTRSWINRNNMLLHGKPFMFHLNLIGASQNKMINEIYIDDQQPKTLKTIETAYKKAPFFSDIYPLMGKIFGYQEKNLSRFVGHSLLTIAEYLCLAPKFVYSSDIKVNNLHGAQEKIIEYCSALNAQKYFQLYVEGLYEKEVFKRHGIDFYFLRSSKPIYYKQFKNEFVPTLSILDVLMFNSVEEINNNMLQYELF